MLDPDACVEVVEAAVEAIAVAAAAHLDAPVEHCPGFDVARLLEHTGGFCRVVEGRVARDEEWKPASGAWQEAPPDEVAGDPVGWHRRWGAELVRSLRTVVPGERIATWAGPRTRYFWFRRAAQELTIHRWDVEHAGGAASAIDAGVALDGIDEFLGEFGALAAPRLDGEGETFLFVSDDAGPSFAVTAHRERFDLNSRAQPDVEARGTADALYRFLWGRARPDELTIVGDRTLLERWQERVRL